MEKKQQEIKSQVRFPLDVLEDIRHFAKEDQRSFNGEIIWILRAYAVKRKERKSNG
jgi:hypothetical protein